MTENEIHDGDYMMERYKKLIGAPISQDFNEKISDQKIINKYKKKLGKPSDTTKQLLIFNDNLGYSSLIQSLDVFKKIINPNPDTITKDQFALNSVHKVMRDYIQHYIHNNDFVLDYFLL
jgi:hypothetical protein